MRFLLTALLAIALFPATATAQVSLVGTYKLVAFTLEELDKDNGSQIIDLFGKQPKGYTTLTPTRINVIVVAEKRTPGTGMPEKAALLSSMVAYSGTYEIKGSRFTAFVDVSWNESMTGTQPGATMEFDGKRLTVLGDQSQSARDPSKVAVRRLVWEKVE